MKLDILIEQLQFLRMKVAGDTEVVLDDTYTPASRFVDNLFIESRDGVEGKEKVIVIRD